jgi:hypothetical protein
VTTVDEDRPASVATPVDTPSGPDAVGTATIETAPTEAGPGETAPTEAGPGEAPDEPRRWRWTALAWDLGAVAGFVAVALYLTGPQWRDISGVHGTNWPDQAFFEWMLAHGARVVGHLDNPFVTHRLNYPDGVNLMANTSILGLSLPLAPVTLAFGPQVSYLVLLAFAFASTGLGWYYVLSRHLVRSRVAALIGSAFCAFAPGMVAQGIGHPNIVAQFLVPFIIWRTLRLRESGRVLRNGAVLGLLITWQAFINEEVLLLTALGVGLFLLITGLAKGEHRRQVLPFLGGLGVAAVVAGALLAYPLWVQFTAPGHYHGLNEAIQRYGANLGSYPAFARLSLAGTLEEARKYTQNPTEENSFLGWPLLVLLGILVLAMVRNLAAVALTVIGLLFATASLGPVIRLGTDPEPISDGPWSWVQSAPIFDTIVPTRMALATAPIAGLLLALAWDRWRRRTAVPPPRHLVLRTIRYASFAVVPAAFLAATVPLLPRQLPVMPRTSAPPLLLDGRLDQYLAGGRSVMFVPPARNAYPDPMSWAAESSLSFRMTQGYFLGPATGPDQPDGPKFAILTSPTRPTVTLIDWATARDRAPKITPQMRRDAVADLRYWRVGALVQAYPEYETGVWRTITYLLGIHPQWIDGAWVWDVRSLTE